MRLRGLWLHALATLLLTACAWPAPAADASDANLDKTCPAFAAWKHTHPELSSKNREKRVLQMVGKPTDTALREKLLSMVKRDQAVRDAWVKAGMKTAGGADPAAKKVFVVDARNLAILKSIVAHGGFPGPARVGVDGAQAAFLLVQHADRDPALQLQVLPQLNVLYAQGLVSGQDVAMLTDRALVGQGKPQRYGTQFVGYDNTAAIKMQPTRRHPPPGYAPCRHRPASNEYLRLFAQGFLRQAGSAAALNIPRPPQV